MRADVHHREVAKAGDLADVLSSTGRIDLTKLATAVDRERTQGNLERGMFETLGRRRSEVPSRLHHHPQLDIVPVEELSVRMRFLEAFDYPPTSRRKLLTHRNMEVDDSPILRHLYRNFRPGRHLEFGTWQGTGTVYCLQECTATVWTINLPGGRFKKGRAGRSREKPNSQQTSLPLLVFVQILFLLLLSGPEPPRGRRQESTRPMIAGETQFLNRLRFLR